MKFELSNRAKKFEANIFNILNDEKKKIETEGRKVYNLSVGTPDFKPDSFIMKAVENAAKDPDMYKYSLGDTDELINAVSKWYLREYNTKLDADEIMSVSGTQEGMMHIALTICNEGDTVLVPNPGYPIFETGPYFCGCNIEYYPLYKEKEYLLDFSDIPDNIANKAKMIVVSYPLNPVCAVAPDSFYVNLIEWAKKHNILVINDNAYSEISYDGKKPFSILSIDGARETAVEFNSLSKTYNLTGLRVSFLLGNKKIVKAFRQIRSQFDYGMPFFAQKAAVAALEGEQRNVQNRRKEYERRRDALVSGLNRIGWDGAESRGSMFVWAPVPSGFSNSVEFCSALLKSSGVVCTPGSSFGSRGEGFVRFALTLPVEQINEAVNSVEKSGIIK